MNNESVNFYPNPSSGLLKFNTNNHASKYMMTISDLCGKTVYEGFIADQTMISLSNLNEGIYIVKIEDASFVKIEKLIIK
jgi:hypothetical protein